MAISNPLDIGGSTLNGSPSGSTFPFTTTATVPSGAKIWVLFAWFDASSTLSSVGGGSLGWTVDRQKKFAGAGTNAAIASADAPSGLASSTVITATVSSANPLATVIAGLYSTGVATGAAAYGGVNNDQTGTTWSSTATTVTSGDILIGVSHWEDSANGTSTPTGGNTEVHDLTLGSGFSMTTVYQIGTGASIAAQGTWSLTASQIETVAVAYQQAGGPVVQPLRPFNPVPLMSNLRI